MLDRLIRGARVFDGERLLEGITVGLQEGRIAHLAREPAPALAVTEAQGALLAPAFIDSHNHADFHVLHQGNDALSALSQGVGALVVGNCGMSATPQGSPDPVLLPAQDDSCVGLAEHARRLGAGLPLHVGDLLGHGTLRTHVLGAPRAAQSAEVDRMAGLLAEFLSGGGLGLSVGLNYPSAVGTARQELLALCRVLARHGRPLACHIRDQAAGIREAVDEVLGLGEETGCKVIVSHLRPISDRFNDQLGGILKRIESSAQFAMDLYPYVAGFTSLAWFFQHILKRLPSAEDRFDAREVWELGRAVCIGSLADVRLLRHRNEAYLGRSITDIAAEKGVEPGLAAQEIYSEDPQCLCIFDHQSVPEIVEQVLRHPRCLIGSDGYLFSSGEQPLCHPRNYAAFTGFLVRYVRSGRIPLEEGLRKMTSRTADFFSLKDLGRIRLGASANLVLFRLEELEERASYAQPAQPAAGTREVILEGRTVYDGRRPLGLKPGRRLRPELAGHKA